MRDNPDKYEVHAVGSIRSTHRFRGLCPLGEFSLESLLICIRSAGLRRLNYRYAIHE